MIRLKKLKLLKSPFVVNFAGHMATTLSRAWMRTIDCRAVFYDQSVDPALGFDRSRIFVFWHENILLPLYVRGNCNLAMLLSQHSDADVLARVANNFGFDCVRGSTYRGAARAIRELAERSHRQHLTITPDGPRGPRRQMSQGPIYLASRLQLPLVVMGFGYDRPWRANSWDRFAVPRPFSRARAIIGPSMMLPPDLDRAGIEHYRLRAERLLNCLTAESEAWATAGTSKAGEILVKPQRAAVTRALPLETPRHEVEASLPARAA
jgi:lysophospholipid acyltransferase (LPLAT)-like uncharacterized protein